MRKQLVSFLSFGLILIIGTGVTIFFAKGYKFNPIQGKFKKTGMLIVKSTPKDAKIYIDGKLRDTTNDTITLAPRTYHIKLEKKGFTPWEKDVPIKPELATEIDALLLPKSPELRPLTTEGINLIQPTFNNTQIAYTSRNKKSPGLWLLNISTPPIIGLVKENPTILLADQNTRNVSLAEELRWKPGEDELLVTLNKEGYLLLETEGGNVLTATSSAKAIISTWQKEENKVMEKNAQKLELPKELEKIAISPDTEWSPNGEKFLYIKKRDHYREYHIYNGEKPLGVGKSRHYQPLTLKEPNTTLVSWHATNQHLIIQKDNQISLMELDGTNRTEIFSGKLKSPLVTPTPNGENIIILTSFKENEPPNFYVIKLK